MSVGSHLDIRVHELSLDPHPSQREVVRSFAGRPDHRFSARIARLYVTTRHPRHERQRRRDEKRREEKHEAGRVGGGHLQVAHVLSSSLARSMAPFRALDAPYGYPRLTTPRTHGMAWHGITWHGRKKRRSRSREGKGREGHRKVPRLWLLSCLPRIAPRRTVTAWRDAAYTPWRGVNIYLCRSRLMWPHSPP